MSPKTSTPPPTPLTPTDLALKTAQDTHFSTLLNLIASHHTHLATRLTRDTSDRALLLSEIRSHATSRADEISLQTQHPGLKAAKHVLALTHAHQLVVREWEDGMRKEWKGVRGLGVMEREAWLEEKEAEWWGLVRGWEEGRGELVGGVEGRMREKVLGRKGVENAGGVTEEEEEVEMEKKDGKEEKYASEEKGQ